jgi:predicted transcriptional regulator of viral defense system
VRSRDLEELDIPRVYLRRLVEQGTFVQETRGVYRATDAEITEHHSLAIASVAVAKGVVCLLSALRYYEIGTQVPHEIWLALPRSCAIPHRDYPPMRFVRLSGSAFSWGRTIHRIEGRSVTMTTPAKTVADCFKFRNQIGIDVAMEALRETLRAKKATVDELWKAANQCRVARIMKPYLEAMV